MSVCMNLIQAVLKIRFCVENDSAQIFYKIYHKYWEFSVLGINFKVTLYSPFKMADHFFGRRS